MKITLAAISPRGTRSKSEATDRLLADYVERAGRYIPCESQIFDSETAVLDWLDRQPGPHALYDPAR
jgi:23S rRNA (pseudouridine1915-N3)-methyltransferase